MKAAYSFYIKVVFKWQLWRWNIEIVAESLETSKFPIIEYVLFKISKSDSVGIKGYFFHNFLGIVRGGVPSFGRDVHNDRDTTFYWMQKLFKKRFNFDSFLK